MLDPRLPFPELGALHNRNAHCREISRRDDPILDDRKTVRPADRATLNRERTAEPEGRERQKIDAAGAIYAGYRADIVENARDGAPKFVVVVPAGRQRDLKRQQTVRVHSCVLCLQAQQALHQQSGARDQHHRKCNLGDDEQPARTAHRR